VGLISKLNHPACPIYIGEIVAGLQKLTDVLLASLFVQGRATNADPDSVSLWIEKVRDIRPTVVQVYTLDRPPADSKIEKVNLPTLQWIAEQVRFQAGLPAEVY
jgi:wyosine [tRNA(Phe)-imidazoG37] synthetase (radical SAM superfamily)